MGDETEEIFVGGGGGGGGGGGALFVVVLGLVPQKGSYALPCILLLSSVVFLELSK